MLVDFELANADLFTPFVITNTLQEHINAVKANYAWGSNTEILAAATLCQIPVYVACDTPPPPPPRWMLESVQTIEKAHHTLCCW